MNRIHEEILKITPGCADASGRLGISETFRELMDMAAIHAEMIGVGFAQMAKRGLFWLTVKTKVIFYERPRMAEQVVLRTWPEAPERVRGNRSYRVLRGDEILIAGKTEWAVINVETGRLAPLKGVYPEELELDDTTAIEEPFSRLADDFGEAELAGVYRVVCTDIDVGRHMNNAAYVRALMGVFTNAELSAREVKSMEVIFKAPCFEGDELNIYRRNTENGFDLKMSRGAETVILARMICE